jgi:hypothetical protein
VPVSGFHTSRFCAGESSVKHMARAVVLAIEPHAVADAEPLHGAAQVGFEMKMIIHQHAGMDSHSEAFRCLGQQFEEMEAVGLATVNRFALVTTGGGMGTAPGRSMRNSLAMGLSKVAPLENSSLVVKS